MLKHTTTLLLLSLLVVNPATGVENKVQKAKQMTQQASVPATVEDHKTQRCEIVERPGCATLVDGRYSCKEGTQDWCIFTGGSCPNGLLEGIVKYTCGDYYAGGRNDIEHTHFILYQQGKEIFSARMKRNPPKPIYKYDVYKFHGDAYEHNWCMGNSASERAKSNPLCEEAARFFGIGVFQDTSDGDDPKVLGGGYRP